MCFWPDGVLICLFSDGDAHDSITQGVFQSLRNRYVFICSSQLVFKLIQHGVHKSQCVKSTDAIVHHRNLLKRTIKYNVDQLSYERHTTPMKLQLINRNPVSGQTHYEAV